MGAGALSIWTHKLNDLRFYPDYSYGTYSGPAFKLGSGVETTDVYALAEANDVTAVGGECRVSRVHRNEAIWGLRTNDHQTVGLAGGYIAGGGHSPLSSLHGMAADQVSLAVQESSMARLTHQTTGPLHGGGSSQWKVRTRECDRKSRFILGSSRRWRQ